MFNQFKDLKKYFLESWKNLENRFFESNTFNLLKERYQSLNIFQQKILRYFLICFVFVVLVYLPVSSFLSSVFYWKEFKQKHSISLELLKRRNKISSSNFRSSQEQLKNQIETLVRKYSNSDPIIKDKKSIFSKKKSIQKIDYTIQVSHLNIKQFIKLGTELHNLSQARLVAIELEESKEYSFHYDITYKILTYVLEKNLKTDPVKLRRKKKKINKRRDNVKSKFKRKNNIKDVDLNKKETDIDKLKSDFGNWKNTEDLNKESKKFKQLKTESKNRRIKKLNLDK